MVERETRPDSRAPAEDDPLAGSQYRLLRRVTAGAMGEVVEAEHVALRRKVMVKLIHRAYAAVPGFIDRFRLEAQSLAALAPRTAHIVGVLDFGEAHDGRPFLVLEHLSGRTLADELRARRMLPLAEALGIMRQLLEALKCAHEVGIVHRDVKPENIFLAESPRGDRIVKLLDFGIAKVLPGASDEDAPAPLALPTEVGTMLGTPRFLAPEQARGAAVDARSDLYSAGAVLYAMLTGRDPFAHVQGIAAVLRAQAMIPPRPPSFVAAQHIPAALDQVVLKVLAKRPEDRYASAVEFALALDGALAPQGARWADTEPLDVTAFQGAGRRGSARPLPDRTEPLDVSVFRGVLRARTSAPEHRAPMLASLGAPATSEALLPPRRSPGTAAPNTMRRPRGGLVQRTATVIAVALVVVAAASLLAALFFLARLR